MPGNCSASFFFFSFRVERIGFILFYFLLILVYFSGNLTLCHRIASQYNHIAKSPDPAHMIGCCAEYEMQSGDGPHEPGIRELFTDHLVEGISNLLRRRPDQRGLYRWP